MVLGDWTECHISKHDVYGAKFRDLWESNQAETVEDQNDVDQNWDDPVDEIEYDSDE